MIDENVKEVLRGKLAQYEGRVEHMYLDTRGYVTVGVGHLLADEESAKPVPFVRRSDGNAASPQEIVDDYQAVKAQKSGLRASAYEPHTQLILPASVIDELTENHILTFEGELNNIYGQESFDSFPEPVRLALFDMIFNLGATKLSRGFPTFDRHINNRQWADAARESHRRGISEARNEYVFDLLNQA